MFSRAELNFIAKHFRKWGVIPTPEQMAGGGAPLGHTHTIAETTGLQSALDGKAGASHEHEDLASAVHGHTISEVAGLGSALDALAAGIASRAAASHTHALAEITDLSAALAEKAATGHGHAIADTTGLQAALDGKSPTSHGHTTANIAGLDAALAGKAASSHAHATADVTGLDAALAAKQATLVSGTNIKTLGGVSLLGSGDIAAGGGGSVSLVSAFLTGTQANSTVTPAVLTGHTFTLAPGQSLLLNGQVVCTAAATTTGFAIGIRVAQANGAGGNVVGSAMLQVALANAAAATQLYDADKFDVAANANALLEILGTATTAGNNGGSYQLALKNNGTSGVATVTVEFRSEVATSAVTAQIGTGCVGVKG